MLVNIVDLILNNVLHCLIHNTDETRIKGNSQTSIKQIIFSLPNFSFGLFNDGPPVSQPFLPSLGLKSKEIYTLILDLDETLAHYFYSPSGGTFLIRPHCNEFLQEMSQYFEVVIFTAAMKDVSII